MSVQENTTNVNHSPAASAALEYAQSGLSVIPIRCDGTKSPSVPWKALQTRIADETTICGWFAACEQGVGIVCGSASGGLEVIDIDDESYWPSFRDEVEARAPGLLSKLPVVTTPRPGRHVYYKCAEISGNQDLAFAANHDGTRGKALIQTRGIGGYVVAPGSPAACHETGRTYVHTAGPPITKTPVITQDEREALLAAARCLTQWVEPARVFQLPCLSEHGGDRPGDDFNARAEWADILEPHGWTFVRECNGISYWTRPGKSGGTSATTGMGDDLLYVFTSNAAPFEAGRAYSKFPAYAMLEHSGDFSAAARQLAYEGYGSSSPTTPDGRRSDKTPANFGNGEVSAFVSNVDYDAQFNRSKPFPVDALPPFTGQFVTEAARALGCDVSYVALPLLAGLAAAIGNTARIRLKRSWVEPPVLWTVVVGNSGTMKSPAIEVALRQVHRRQERAIAEYELELSDYKCQAESPRGRNSASGTITTPAPIAARYLTNDCTIEALARLLQNQPRGLLVVRDELAGWFASFDQYKKGKGAEVPRWLEAFGARSLTVDRVSGDPPMIHVPNAAVCVTGGIQPGILRRSLTSEHRDSGLAARLLMAYPPRQPKRWTEADITAHIEALIEKTFDRLYSLPLLDRPIELELCPAAKSLWIEFYNEHADQQMRLSDAMTAIWSKLEGYAPRLALVLYLTGWAESQDDEGRIGCISADAMESAITLTRWFGDEAKRIHSLLEGDGLLSLAELIRKMGGRVTARELSRKYQAQYKTASEAELALNQLQGHGYGRWKAVTPGAQGGRPTSVFILDDTDTTKTSINPEVEGGFVIEGGDTPSEGDWGEL